jgi:hypothetical protein
MQLFIFQRTFPALKIALFSFQLKGFHLKRKKHHFLKEKRKKKKAVHQGRWEGMSSFL